ncbi:MAG: 8-oxo-dGTP diphosphatase MutT [Cyanobacteria bacterium MAG CAR1_bin_15]|nr:8-oxo-dGTP diphosphatase MutT [Cyanobacteria bacterium MAG CAR1_bin_15]
MLPGKWSTAFTEQQKARLRRVAPHLVSSLLNWWRRHGRHDLPWRLLPDGRQPEPDDLLPVYPVWVAEVMLQQTRLAVALPFWRRWRSRFPDLEFLAAASRQEVLHCWQGLGYYVRARRLHEVATRLAAAGRPLPTDRAGLEQLPGLGRTTAAAIAATTGNSPDPVLDGNVQRVLARLLAFPAPPRQATPLFWTIVELLLDHRGARDFNQALMDLGALVCRPRTPLCHGCPWRPHCHAYGKGIQRQLPVRQTPAPVPHVMVAVGIVLDHRGKVLIGQRQPDGLLGGLWEFPGGKQEPGETMAETVARELQEEVGLTVAAGPELLRFDHAYTHRRLTFAVYLCRVLAGEARPVASRQVAWVWPRDLHHYPFPAAHARMIQALRRHLDRSGGA